MERATAGLRLPNDEAEGATTMRSLDSPSAAWDLAFINRGIASADYAMHQGHQLFALMWRTWARA